jgi:DNA-binding beta-propeller fold protein YncE
LGVINKKMLDLWEGDFHEYGSYKEKFVKIADYLKCKLTASAIINKIVFPSNIEVGSQGNIYSIGHDIYGKTGVIGIIDPNDGHTIAAYRVMGTEEAEHLYPRDIAVDGEGNIYLTNFKDYPIKKFSKDGKFIKGIGKRGNGEGEFIWPWAIAANRANNDIYATDVFAPRAKEFEKPNLCVQKFTGEGKFLRRWGGEWIKFNGLFPPSVTLFGANNIEFAEGIAVDSKGYVYVLEKFGPRVSKYDSKGRLKKRWGRKGSAPGQFSAPEGICVDKDDNVYVADTGNNRVQKFDSNGKFLMEIK